MAQDPEEEQNQAALDTSQDFDMVNLYDSQTIDAEVEANMIKGLLDANGIPAVLSGTPYPNLGYFVKVPRGRLEDARRVVAEAEAAGTQAAVEAEAESEKEL